MQDVRAQVLSVTAHPLPYYTLRLALPEGFRATRPGQFVMIQVGDRLEPYLRRAFSVLDLKEGRDGLEGEILAKVVGRGTDLLSRSEPGEILQVLGPLGRGFEPGSSGRVALVAGGVGSAALLLLARELARAETPFDFFYGGRSAVDLARWGDFDAQARASGGETVLVTEDGSLGQRGLVTEPLEERIEAGTSYEELYACGPMALLARLAEIASRRGVSGQAALETPMGCGFGACLGCAVPHAEGRWALCCKEGPVFRFAEVRW